MKTESFVLGAFLTALFAVVFFAGGVSAANTLTVTENSTNFTVSVGGSTSYTFNVSLHYTGAAADLGSHTIDFVVPYGLTNSSACNGTLGWRALTYNGNKYKYYACQMNYTGNIANFTTRTMVFTANISAYSDVNTTDFSGIKYFWTNTTTNTSVAVTNSTPYPHNSTNYYINPRPFIEKSSATAVTYKNYSVNVMFWNSTDPFYRVLLPLETYNQTANMPMVANNTFGDVMYLNRMMMERPTFMRLSGFNLTLDFRDLSSVANDYYYYAVRLPINNTLHPYQQLFPLLIYNQTQTDPFDNTTFNMTMGTPAREGFTVYAGTTAYTDTTLAALGVNLTFSPSSQDTVGMLFVNISSAGVAVVNGTQLSVAFSPMNFSGSSGGTASPLFVNSQSFDRDAQQPKFGQNVSFSYYGNYTNILANYTYANLSLSYFLPVNVTIIEGNGSNATHVISNGTGFYWSNGTRWVTTGVLTNYNCTNVTDNMPGSPVENKSIYVCFITYELQLNHARFANWAPNASGSNLSIKVNGTMSFPSFGESSNFSNAPPSAGQSQSFSASFSSSSRSSMNLTDKVPWFTGSTNPSYLTITVDGQNYTNGSNYTLGSLYLTDVSSGSHVVSITYGTPSSSSSSNPNQGGGSTPTPAATATATAAPTAAPTWGGRSTGGTEEPSWEEPEPEATAEPTRRAPTVAPTSAASSSENTARANIAAVRDSIAGAKSRGVNVAEAERFLALAQQALNSGQYALASENAQLAKNALANAESGAKKQVAGGVDWTLVAIIIIVVLAGAAYLFSTRKKKSGL